MSQSCAVGPTGTAGMTNTSVDLPRTLMYKCDSPDGFHLTASHQLLAGDEIGESFISAAHSVQDEFGLQGPRFTL